MAKAILTESGIVREIRFRYAHPTTKKMEEFRRRFALSEKDAVELEARLRGAARKGKLSEVLAIAEEIDRERARCAPSRGPTFADFVETWWDESVLGHKNKRGKPNSLKTRQQRRSQLDRHLLPALGTLFVKEIDGTTLEECVVKPLLAAHGLRHPERVGEGNATIENARITLNAIFERAVKADIIHKNPVKAVEWPAPPEHEMRFYTLEETDRFFEAALRYDDSEYWYSLLFLVARTGLCEGEVFGLRPGDLQLTPGVPAKVHVARQVQEGEECEPKWGRKRWVDLDEDVVRVMRGYLEWRKHRFPEATWLFPSLKTDNVVTFPSKYVARPLQDVAAIAGVKPLTLHELRHTRGSHLAQVDGDARVIGQQLGHRVTATTERYIHLAGGRGAEAAAKVAKLSNVALPTEIVDLAERRVGTVVRPPVKRLAVPNDQQAILRLIERGPQTIPAIASKMPWPKKRVHRLLVILECAGLIHKNRVDGAKHGTKVVTLTDKGRDAVDNGMKRAVNVASVLAPSTTKREIASAAK